MSRNIFIQNYEMPLDGLFVEGAAMIKTMISRPSVCSLRIQMKFGSTILSSGTGFVVQTSRGPALVTNRHNVTGRHQETDKLLSPTGGVPNSITITHNLKGPTGSWIDLEETLYTSNETPRWIEHPRLKSQADFVILPLVNRNNIEFYSYDPSQPGPAIEVTPGEIVSVVGFPFNLSTGGGLAIWATGFVASEPSIPDEPTFLIDCRGRPGQSGSAVICYRNGGFIPMMDGSRVTFMGPVHRFLGIYSGRINEMSDLGTVWKASAIAEAVAVV